MHTTANKHAGRNSALRMARLPLAVAIYFAISSTAFAQADSTVADQSAPAPKQAARKSDDKTLTLGEVTVTAQKRTENLQKVPISVAVLSGQKLEDHNATSFADYAKLLPSISYLTYGPGVSTVYMRGVSDGSVPNHSASQPTVGTYLDEAPVTTIGGTLDVHMYDIARVEALAGPQGTLYGASSEAGTIRIITNKPDASKFAAGYAVEGSKIQGGGIGNIFEGYINQPISKSVAIRLVGWTEHDGGYIDNVYGRRTYPTSGITIDNALTAKNNYNDVQTNGMRGALKVDFGDDWSATATLMGQNQRANGFSAFDPVVGKFKVTHFFPEKSDDHWAQAALTVQGKIGNFDLTYAYSNLTRHIDTQSDYSDYSFWYDTLYGSGNYFYDNLGGLIDPSQKIIGVDRFKRQSHELRISSPKEDRLRFTAGVFWEKQLHDIQQDYMTNGDLATSLEVPGWKDTIWLTKQVRSDQDEAVFGEMSFDITKKLTATAGIRYFKDNNSLKGFFGFSDGYSSHTGVAACQTPFVNYLGAPCINLDKRVKQSDHISRLNLTYQLDDHKMLYATWSEGYRPGGINRRGSLPPYLPDFLTNYEIGWKTSWLDNRVTFNGSVFQEDWNNFQFAVLGAQGLTEIRNAPQARIRGLEGELNWAATYNLRLSGGFSIYDSKLTKNYCAQLVNEQPVTNCSDPAAFSGTQLPATPRFKGDLTARYSFDLGSYDAFVQGAMVHVGKRRSDLRDTESSILGSLPSYTLFDLSAGVNKNGASLEFYVKNLFNTTAESWRFTECGEAVCGNAGHVVVPGSPGYTNNGSVYTVPSQPRTFGIRFSQDF
jgi:outer membrane receptor protein involved in Fe transport